MSKEEVVEREIVKKNGNYSCFPKLAIPRDEKGRERESTRRKSYEKKLNRTIFPKIPRTD